MKVPNGIKLALAALTIIAGASLVRTITQSHAPHPTAVQTTFIAIDKWNAGSTSTHAGLLNTECDFHEWKVGVPIVCQIHGSRGVLVGLVTFTPTSNRYSQYQTEVTVY